MLESFDWLRWVDVPLIGVIVGLLWQHIHRDNEVELLLKVKQAFLEGEVHGLNERISRLEDIRDFKGRPFIFRDRQEQDSE